MDFWVDEIRNGRAALGHRRMFEVRPERSTDRRLVNDGGSSVHTLEVDCRKLQLGINVYGRTVTHVAVGSAAEELIQVGDRYKRYSWRHTCRYICRYTATEELIHEGDRYIRPRALL